MHHRLQDKKFWLNSGEGIGGQGGIYEEGRGSSGDVEETGNDCHCHSNYRYVNTIVNTQ